MTVPLWKVRRELRATYDQGLALLIQLAFPFIRLQKRLFPTAEPSPLKGQKTLGKRVVLYLVFPGSDDDLSDRLDALDYFQDRSASVVCVINGTVAPHWLEQFARRCAYVLTRANKGYDFGGYQRGVLFLNELGHGFEHLHIINDSVLMPVVLNETIFNDIESAATTGFGGAVALPMGEPAAKGGTPARPALLALSYWLYFSGAVARSACFQSYWLRYVATSSKVLTVRHGERGLSRYMATQGHPATALHTVESVAAVLQGLAPEVFARILHYASFTDEPFAARCAELVTAVEQTPEWSESARSFIQEVALRRNFLHSFCYLSHEVLHIPFIKKTRIRLPYLMRQKYIAAVERQQIKRPPDRIWNRLLQISR
jgi:hypothetical protein